jgi:CRISPR-associated endonuclease/helicase Cas3
MMPVTWPDLAVRVRQHDEVLAVVHRRDDARELATLVPNSIHLSALMCPNHRLHVLDEIKGRLAANRARRAERGKVEPVRIISTQLVEAGVDLDLPTVYRALGGFDSIAQAAGRCNREGLLPDGQLGRVIVFTAPTKPPPGTPQQGLDVARAMLANDPGLDALDPKLFDQYFRRLYFGRQLDAGSVQSLRAALRFKSVAEAFQVIADAGGVAVIVPYGDAPTRLEELRRDGPSRERLRALQPFAVTLYKQQVETLQKAGAIETIADTVLAVNATTHKNLYDPQFGLVLTGPLAADAEALCQ